MKNTATATTNNNDDGECQRQRFSSISTMAITQLQRLPASLVPGGPMHGTLDVRIMGLPEDEEEDRAMVCFNPSSKTNHQFVDALESDDGCSDDKYLEDDEVQEYQLSRIPVEKIVLEGLQRAPPRPRLIYIQVAAFVLGLVLVALSSSLITIRLSNRRSHSGGNNPTQGLLPSPTMAPSSLTLEQWTIADAWGILGTDILSWVAHGHSLDLFLNMVNRTDTNFTFFPVRSDASLLDDRYFAVLSLWMLPMWGGHMLDVLESRVVEGHVLLLDDMHDGMVLTSVAGYPLTIQRDPFRVNNARLSLPQTNSRYKNGVVHFALEYSNPPVPWISKSLFDVLVETNNLRNGDLSKFIALIDATPDIKNQLQEGRKGEATTLFCPTNAALLSTFEPDNNTQFLQHHIVSGNFAKRCWWTTTCETEPRLESQAGSFLEINVTTDVVTIHDDVSIIQEDIFFNYGVLHVVDKSLP